MTLTSLKKRGILEIPPPLFILDILENYIIMKTEVYFIPGYQS